MVTYEDKLKAQQLYLEGKRLEDIAELFHVSRTYVYFWLKELKTPMRTAGAVNRSIPMLKKVLDDYHGRVTLRQLFYRLVSAGIIPNTEIAYNTLGKQTVVARKRGEIPYEAFEDRSRDFIGGQLPFTSDTPESIFESAKDSFENAEDTFRDSYEDYDLPLWYGQPKYVEVWLEKEALANVLSDVTKWKGVLLAPCKGYPSLSFVYEASKRFNYIKKVAPEKEFLILYFGDYDMRGLDIERNINQTFEEDFGIDVTVERIALTREQIEKYNLPPQPSKTKDPMARGWIETHGDVAWELDALDPNVLTNLVRDAVERNISKSALDLRSKKIAEGQEYIRLQIEKYFEEDDS
jgi:hypothetical protein